MKNASKAKIKMPSLKLLKLRKTVLISVSSVLILITPTAVLAATTTPTTPPSVCGGATSDRGCTTGTASTPSTTTTDQNAGKDLSFLGNGCLGNNSGQLLGCQQKSKIVADVQKILEFMAAGVAIAITGVIIFAGFQYMIGGDNANSVANAKKSITRALVALLFFALVWSFLNWLVPNGV